MDWFKSTWNYFLTPLTIFPLVNNSGCSPNNLRGFNTSHPMEFKKIVDTCALYLSCKSIFLPLALTPMVIGRVPDEAISSIPPCSLFPFFPRKISPSSFSVIYVLKWLEKMWWRCEYFSPSLITFLWWSLDLFLISRSGWNRSFPYRLGILWKELLNLLIPSLCWF